MLKGVLTNVFGTRHDREKKRVQPIVDQINEEYERLQSISEEELRGQTTRFRERIAEATKERPDAQQIHTMLADGMQIGSHTVHHVNMGSLVLYSTALAQHELQASQAALQNHLGIPIQQFCYPSGEPFRHGSLAARQQIVSMLAADGYVGATTDPGMSGVLQSSQTPLALLRIRVDGRSTLQFFTNTLPW